MTKNKVRLKLRIRPLTVILLVLLLISCLCYTSAKWYEKIYGSIGFDSVLYTLFSDMGGVEMDLVISFVKDAVLFAGFFFVVVAGVLFFPARGYLALQIFGSKKIRLFPFHRVLSCILCLAICSYFLVHAAKDVQLDEYIESVRNPSHFFEENYIDPAQVEITFPEEKRNLVFIYLESMEVSQFAAAQGGTLPYNTIPELYQLAQENINFSHTDGIGGAYSTSGTTWTIGAMVAHTAGIPLKTLANDIENEYGLSGGFLPGVTTLMDILHENGYYQSLMVGSDGTFGGRYEYYMGHGADIVYDYYDAMDAGIIPHGYHVFWGMEDKYLFEYAKRELTEIAKKDQPFAFNMLTVDTHHTEGYICSLCESEYDEPYENAYACSSRQVSEFVQWLQQQPFYENTTVILVGDHPTMGAEYMSRVRSPGYSRRMYNCFLNSVAQTENVKNRKFCTMDMFPTTLAAIGCTIEGDRLGLGTNLFSDRTTMMEEMGIGKFDKEVSVFSRYYIETFAK